MRRCERRADEAAAQHGGGGRCRAARRTGAGRRARVWLTQAYCSARGAQLRRSNSQPRRAPEPVARGSSRRRRVRAAAAQPARAARLPERLRAAEDAGRCRERRQGRCSAPGGRWPGCSGHAQLQHVQPDDQGAQRCCAAAIQRPSPTSIAHAPLHAHRPAAPDACARVRPALAAAPPLLARFTPVRLRCRAYADSALRCAGAVHLAHRLLLLHQASRHGRAAGACTGQVRLPRRVGAGNQR